MPRVGHHDTRLGVADNVVELGGAERRVQRVEDRAGLEDPEGRDEVLDRVAEGERHALPARHAERCQRPRRPAREPVELRVRHAPALVHDEGMRAARGDVAGERVEDRVGH